MQIDEKTLEAIVREVVERLLSERPDLFTSSQEQSDAILDHFGRVLSEDDLLVCRKQGKRAIRIDTRTIVTPLAKDRARELGVRILRRESGL
jgi:hypothetical protein